jgi:hypothetical protein
MKNIHFKALVILFCVSIGGHQALAQPASSYDYINGSLSSGYLSGGTAVNKIEVDDAISNPIPIGFTFNFCGTDYTQIIASSNGWLSFNTAATASTPMNSSTNLLSIRPALFPLWDDLSGSVGAASFGLVGTAPDRAFVMEFKKWKWNWGATSGGITFQVFLFEGSNTIQYRYIRETGSVSLGSASIGIADDDGTFLSLNTSAVASSTGFTTTINGKPPTGYVFQFSPQQCTTPAPGATLAAPAVLSCLGMYTNLSIASPPPAVKTGNSYQWQSSPDNITYTDIAGATALTYRVAPASTAWYRCNVTCKFGPSTVASTPVQVTLSGSAPAAMNGTRCGVGSVALTASAASAATLRWYEAPVGGGVPVATGSPFITPDLAATTHYYVGNEVTGNDTIAIGAGANTTVSSKSASDRFSPFDHGYGGIKSQYLFTAEELWNMGLRPGNITALAFDVVSGGKLHQGFNLSIGTTTDTELTLTPVSGLTNVYSTTAPAGLTTPASGLAVFTFPAPFAWDGASSLVVQTCWSNNNTGGTGTTVRYDATTFPSLNIHRQNSATAAILCATATMGLVQNFRPKVLFMGPAACSSPRKKVTVTINKAPVFTISDSQAVCNNSPAQMSVTSPVTNYTEYVWSPATDLYTDALCTLPYIAGSSAPAVYAKTAGAGKVTYTCSANNSVTLCAAIDSADVTTLPDVVTTEASPAMLCRSGMATLTLSPSGLSPAAFQWAGSPDNVTFTDIASAAGASYRTPGLSTTRYFRVSLKNSAGAFCLNSVPDTVQVLNPVVTGTMDSARCGPGSVTLSATGDGGLLKWYSASAGGTALATGSTFTTPDLTATTTYYVSTEAVEMSCKSVRVPVKVTVNALPKPAITPSDFVLICEGNTARLTGSGGGDYQWRNTSGHIAGASGNTYDATSPDDYQVIVTTTATGCKDSSKPIRVIVAPRPTVSVTPDYPITICADSFQEYTAVTTGAPLTYQWYEGNIPIAGAIKSSYKATDAGLYTLRVSNGACSDTSNEAALKNNPLPPAGFTESDTRDAICTGDSLELTAIIIPAGSVYQWLFNGNDIPGATKQKYYATTGGAYSIRIRDANNCRKESDVLAVFNTPMGIPLPSPKEARFCEGTAITIYANGGPYADKYLWMKDSKLLPDRTHAINTAVAGYYEVTVTDIYGCKATSGKVSITVMPLPVKPVITHSASLLSAPGIYTSYQWYRNGKVISGETKRTLKISFDGKYHVVVSNSEGCYNNSDTLVLNNLAVERINVSGAVVKIYPNPSQDIVYIEAPLPVNLKVQDAQGRLLAEISDARSVDMSSYAEGAYLFTITGTDGQVLTVQRILKKTE